MLFTYNNHNHYKNRILNRIVHRKEFQIIPINMSIGFTLNLFFIYIALVSISWIIYKIFLKTNVVFTSKKKLHSWKSIRILNRTCYCSICEMVLNQSNGQFCDACGVCCHPDCIKIADETIQCKEKYVKNEKSISHKWVKGNLPLDSECNYCKLDIDQYSVPGLFGYRCCWCQRTYHDECFKYIKISEECDFGPYRDMIIPPTSIGVEKNKNRMKIQLASVIPPDWDNWKPLIVIANTKSGSSTASDLAALLRGILHPTQVMELSSKGPQEPLQWALKISPKQTRVLVAGGDGTIGWVLNTIFSLGIKPIPEVSIMPLGTGNDLSRIMNWGSKPPSTLNAYQILDDIKNAKTVTLDRWVMEVEITRYRLPIQCAPLRTYYVYNYFSLGVDALVALNFHQTRESPFYILSNRILNKLIYFGFGTQQILQRDCENIERYLDLFLDDQLITLPELQSIIFLNIDSWGAGVKLCELSGTENSVSDGIMEVFGIVSSFHIAQLQVGLSKPIRLGRAKHIRIKIKHPVPVQADGEPWIQIPCEIRLQPRGQAKLLKKRHNSTT